MAVVLSGIILVIVAGCFAYRRFRKPVPQQNDLTCERSEDRGFYADIGPDDLERYQSALLPVFALLEVAHFFGTVVPAPVRDAVERMLADAAVNLKVNPKYLRVMLLQFLQADVTRRSQNEVAAHWAERVCEMDRGDSGNARRWIPSAWKVYFLSSMNTEPVITADDRLRANK